MTKVVNIKNSELRKIGYRDFNHWNSLPQNIYIGRANSYLGVPASKFANPYRITSYSDRTSVLEKYENYIRSSPQLLKCVNELDMKTLGCYCFPEKCHGDILIKILKEKVSDIVFVGYNVIVVLIYF